jgi:hypothetical protein
MRSSVWYLSLIAAILFVCPSGRTGTCLAQWTNSPSFNLFIDVTFTDGMDEQWKPGAVSDGAGGTIIGWISGGRVFAQRVTNAGIKQWDVGGWGCVPICMTGACYALSIISDAGGGAFLTWHDLRSGSRYQVYAQWVDNAGVPRWQSDGVAICPSPADQFHPAIAADGAGGAIIAWEDMRNSGPGIYNHDIYVQRVDGNGAALWPSNGVALSIAPGMQLRPKVLRDGTGGAIVAWDDHRGGSFDSYAQRIDANGNIQWDLNGAPICTANGDQTYQRMVSDGNGGVVIVWQDWRNWNWDIYAQRVDANGKVQWLPDAVAVGYLPQNQEAPSIIGDGAGGAIIVWQDYRSSNHYDVFAQRIDGNGAIKWWPPNGRSICTAQGHQTSPVIVEDGLGGAIIAWVDGRLGGVSDIYAQRISAVGGLMWATEGVALCTAENNQAWPVLVTDGAGGTIGVWNDFRAGGTWRVYAQRVDAQGQLVGIPPYGNIMGNVTLAGAVVAGLKVMLADMGGNPLPDIMPTTTDENGHYSFNNVLSVPYFVIVVEPLGYYCDQGWQYVTLAPGATLTVDFTLEPAVSINSVKGKGYWMHQFGACVTGNGKTQEGDEYSLLYLIGLVQQHYTPHFDVFANAVTLVDWLQLLCSKNHETMLDRAKGELSALVLNLASQKIGQYMVVTADNRTAGDVLTYVSQLATDGSPSNDELAKDLAEEVNNQKTIRAGIVPVGGILYKGLSGTIDWRFDKNLEAPKSYALYNNYPNPFNPSTTIKYELPKTSEVRLSVFDMLGREVSVLVNERRDAGVHEVRFIASNFSSGVYLYRIRAGEFVQTRKLLLLK